MQDYPRTILEFEKRFATEQACRQFLFDVRWPEGVRCSRCGHDHAWPTTRGLWKCAQCGRQISVTAGTIFQGSHRPLRVWFRALWYVTSQKQGVSALGLQRVLGLGSYRTAWTWLHKLRRAMVRPGRERLTGTVEVDETYLGGPRPGKTGRGAAGKTLVVVAAQERPEGIGRIRLRRVRDASAKSLTAAVEQMIEPGSLVRTDDWNGYAQLPRRGYRRDVVRQGGHVGDNLLPLANRVASLLKRWLLGTHHGAVRVSHLDYYLDEFTFRFNRRTSRSRGKLFLRLVEQAAMVPPVQGSVLRGARP